jgi:hypothetical protein
VVGEYDGKRSVPGRDAQLRSQIVIHYIKKLGELRCWDKYDGFEILVMLETIYVEARRGEVSLFCVSRAGFFSQ